MPALPAKLQRAVEDLGSLDPTNRTLLLLDYAAELGPFPEEEKTDEHLVRGCVSRVWLVSEVEDGRMRFRAAADGQIAQGMAALLVNGLSGEPPGTVAALTPDFIRDAGLAEALTPGRQGGLAAMLARMQRDARAALAPSS